MWRQILLDAVPQGLLIPTAVLFHFWAVRTKAKYPHLYCMIPTAMIWTVALCGSVSILWRGLDHALVGSATMLTALLLIKLLMPKWVIAPIK